MISLYSNANFTFKHFYVLVLLYHSLKICPIMYTLSEKLIKKTRAHFWIIGIPYTDFGFRKRRCIFEYKNVLIFLISMKIRLKWEKIKSSFDDAGCQKIPRLKRHRNEIRIGQGNYCRSVIICQGNQKFHEKWLMHFLLQTWSWVRHVLRNEFIRLWF